MEKSIKNIKAQFKADGVYYTPPELAETLKSYVDFEPKKVYDPTVGQGNLLAVFDDDVEKYGQELYADELKKAEERLKNFHGYCGNTLYDDGFKDEKFDLIVANPPFSQSWEPNYGDIRWQDAPCIPTKGNADYAFLLHILYHLSNDGKAICLSFPGILYRGKREGRIRQWLIEQNYIERVVSIPGKTFTDTAIATAIVVLNKNKKTTDIIFEDKELQQEKTVTFEEVKSQYFNLSVSLYIQRKDEKEPFDPVEAEKEVRKSILKQIEAQIKMSALVVALDKSGQIPPLIDFIDDIQTLTEKYRDYKAVI